MKTGRTCDSPCFSDFPLDRKSSLHQQTTGEPPSPNHWLPLDQNFSTLPLCGLVSTPCSWLPRRTTQADGWAGRGGGDECGGRARRASLVALLHFRGLSSPVIPLLAELPAGAWGGGVWRSVLEGGLKRRLCFQAQERSHHVTVSSVWWCWEPRICLCGQMVP